MTTFEKVIGLMAQHRDIDTASITPETTFAEIWAWTPWTGWN